MAVVRVGTTFAVAEAEGKEVEVQPAARAFRLVEQAVAATNDRAVSDAVRESKARGELLRVVPGDVERQARLTARLYQVPKQ